jgi:hypothetical protein
VDRLRGWPWWSIPTLVFLATRIPSGLMLAWLGRDQLPPPAFVPGQSVPTRVDPPTYWHLVANWDGQWYQRAAEHGFPSHLPMFHGAVAQNTWGFYPLYPTTVRAVMLSGLPFGPAASLVSIACATVAVCLLYRMLLPTCGRFAATMTVLALSTYPASVTLQVAYTESMALLFAIAALMCLGRRRYVAVLLFAVLLSLTRPIVLPLALVVGVHWLVRWRRRRTDPFPAREAVGVACVAVLTALTFLIWPLTAAVATGRWDAYAATRNAWDLEQAKGWPSWLLVFVGDGTVALRIVVGVGVVALGWAVTRRWAALWGRELRTWAWAYPLFLLGTTRPTFSIFRYAMLAAVPWWPFPEAGRTVVTARSRTGLALFVLLLGLATQLVWMRWFYVVTPASLGYP